MNEYSIYKKYLYYLISPYRNTRPITIRNNIYIPSPLSYCINSDTLDSINEIKLLNSYITINKETDSDSDKDDFIVVEYFIDD